MLNSTYVIAASHTHSNFEEFFDMLNVPEWYVYLSASNSIMCTTDI